MTDHEAHDDTPANDWDDTEELDEDANEERERLRVKLGLAAGVHRRMIDGRYEILKRQGQGGMGVVYHARDLRLDRDVALKLVRSRPFCDEDRLRDRLEREAKALAKLDGRDHVVAVYDVGRHRDCIYFTMPYIQGVDLRQWQDAETRSVDQILDVYLQAARGLEAAHEHGIVHRDFKPSNVLMRTEDQRVLVADFGIAEVVSKLETPPEGIESALRDPQPLTATGAVLGTLPYVAPERLPAEDRPAFRGAPASDQFSFCVALWEAIAGEVPFEAGSPAKLLEAIEHEPRGEGRIPGWLRPLLRRGLARDPDARFPSMAELFRAIERRRHRRRRLAFAGASLTVVIALSIAVFLAGSRTQVLMEHRIPCSTFSDSAAAVWSEQRRQALVERRTLAPEMIDHVIAQLDTLMHRWVTAGERTCEGGYAPLPDDPRVECLDPWLRVASVYIELLAEIDDVQTATRAGEVVDRLLPPGDSFCTFSPSAIVDFELWTTTEAARAAAVLGADDRALELAERALAQAETRASGRAHTAEFAEAYSARAEVFARQQHYDAALRDFEEADVHAHLAGHRDREISNQTLWAKVRALSGKSAFDYDKALEDIERKRRLLTVVTTPELRARLEAELEDAAGFVEFRREAYREALAHHERARALLTPLDQPVLLAKTLNNLGAAHQMLGQFDEARDAYQRARQILDAAQVPLSHSTSIEIELNLGILAVELDQSAGFDHLATVAQLSSGATQLEALDQALTLAVNLNDESRMRALSEDLLERFASQPPDSELRLRTKFDVATALVRLGDPRGDELFAEIDELAPDHAPPALVLALRRSHIRALEERDRCADAAHVLAETDEYARKHALVDDEFRKWRAKREVATCELVPLRE